MGNQEYWQILAPWYLDPKSIYSCSYDLHIHLIVLASSCTIPFLVSTLIFNSLFPSTHSLSAISTNFLISMICRCHFWGNKNVCWSLMSCPYEFLNAIFVIWETKMLWRVFFFFLIAGPPFKILDCTAYMRGVSFFSTFYLALLQMFCCPQGATTSELETGIKHCRTRGKGTTGIKTIYTSQGKNNFKFTKKWEPS